MIEVIKTWIRFIEVITTCSRLIEVIKTRSRFIEVVNAWTRWRWLRFRPCRWEERVHSSLWRLGIIKTWHENLRITVITVITIVTIVTIVTVITR